VGRVHLNLPKTARSGCAFRLSGNLHYAAGGECEGSHLPLGKLLGEYAGAANKGRRCPCSFPCSERRDLPWLKALVDAAEIFTRSGGRPMRAIRLLRDVPQLESAGVCSKCRRRGGATGLRGPRVSAQIGGKAPVGLGLNTLLDFQMEVTLDGERLTAAEIRELLRRNPTGWRWSAPLGGSGRANGCAACWSTSVKWSARLRSMGSTFGGRRFARRPPISWAAMLRGRARRVSQVVAGPWLREI